LPAFLPVECAQAVSLVVIGLGPERAAAVSAVGGMPLGEAQSVLGQLVLGEVGPMGDPHAAVVAPPAEPGTEVEAGEQQPHEVAEHWRGGREALEAALPPGFRVASE